MERQGAKLGVTCHNIDGADAMGAGRETWSHPMAPGYLLFITGVVIHVLCLLGLVRTRLRSRGSPFYDGASLGFHETVGRFQTIGHFGYIVRSDIKYHSKGLLSLSAYFERHMVRSMGGWHLNRRRGGRFRRANKHAFVLFNKLRVDDPAHDSALSVILAGARNRDSDIAHGLLTNLDGVSLYVARQTPLSHMEMGILDDGTHSVARLVARLLLALGSTSARHR
jgi:hypothetical protein